VWCGFGINVSGFGSPACTPFHPMRRCTPRPRASTDHSHRTRHDLQLCLHHGQLELDLSGLHGDVGEHDGEIVDGLGVAVLTLHPVRSSLHRTPSRLARSRRPWTPSGSLGSRPVPSRRGSFTYAFLIKVLAAVGLPPMCAIHYHIVKHESVEDTFVGNVLLDAYSKNGGGFLDAMKMLDEMPTRDIVSWNMAMATMVRHDEVAGVRRMFDEMAERDTVNYNTIMDVYPCVQCPNGHVLQLWMC
jgi:pentatricopeptide repeat protein